MFQTCAVVLLTLVVLAKSESIYNKCGDKLKCIEQEMIKSVDEVDEQENISVLGDFLSIEKVKGYREEVPRSEDVIERVLRYVDEHQLKIQVPKQAIQEARSSKIKKILLPLLLLLKLKAAIVIPAVLSAIALVAFKSLGVSLLAFVISAFTAFKGLLQNHTSSKFSYEIVPQLQQQPQWSRTGVNTLDAWPPQAYHTIP